MTAKSLAELADAGLIDPTWVTPLAPVATPRRDSGNRLAATPGAGTQTPAPPNPAITIPMASCRTELAVASTTRPVVVRLRPIAISRCPGIRIDATITTIEPMR